MTRRRTRTAEEFERALERATRSLDALTRSAGRGARGLGGGRGGGGLGGGGGAGPRRGRPRGRSGGKIGGKAGSPFGAGRLGGIFGVIAGALDPTGGVSAFGSAISGTLTRQTTIGGGSTASNSGFQNLANNARLGFLQGASELPIFGGAAAGIIDPINRAGERTSQIAETIARAGGQIDDDLIKGLNQRFVEEETRARNARRQVQRNITDESGNLVGTAREGSRAEELIEALRNLDETIRSFNPFGG